MSRAQKDLAVKVTHALPNAANTVNTNGIDLGAVTPFPIQESFEVSVTIGAATGANSKNINTRLQDSADNSSFTNIAELASFVVANNASVYTATTRKVKLPSGTQRYIRTTSVGEANGGDASDGVVTLELLF
jgi:hypothetical protein